MQKKIHFLAAIILLLSIFKSGAQPAIERSVIASAGGSNTAGGYSIDWTMGEAVIGNFSAGANILSQGFHQQDKSTGLSIERVSSLDARVFPNPVSDKLWIEIDQSGAEALSVLLVDMNGKQLYQNVLPAINKIRTSLDMSGYAAGVYMLAVLKQGKLQHTATIVKE